MDKPLTENCLSLSPTTGKFQNVALPTTTMLGESTGVLPAYYADAAVIAYRLPRWTRIFTELKPKLSSSGGSFNLKDLTDGDLNTTNFLPPMAVGEDMWIQYEFETPKLLKPFQLLAQVIQLWKILTAAHLTGL